MSEPTILFVFKNKSTLATAQEASVLVGNIFNESQLAQASQTTSSSSCKFRTIEFRRKNLLACIKRLDKHIIPERCKDLENAIEKKHLLICKLNQL